MAARAAAETGAGAPAITAAGTVLRAYRAHRHAGILCRLPMFPSFVLAVWLAGLQDPAPAPVPETVPGEPVLPLRLEDVVRLVGQNSPNVRQAHLATLANLAGIEQSEGIFDPLIFADATYTYSESPTAGGFLSGQITSRHERRWELDQGVRGLLLTGATYEVQFAQSYSEDNLPPSIFGFNPESDSVLSFALTQPLLKGGWQLTTEFPVRQAELAYDSSLAGLRQSAQDALQQAVDAYWNLAFALEDVKVKEFSLQLAEELKEVTEAKLRVGAAAEVEVVQTQADIAQRTVELLAARQVVGQAQDSLRYQIFQLEELDDWRVDVRPSSEPPEAVASALGWEDALETARRYRADLRQARVDLERFRDEWEVRRKQLLPALNLAVTGNSLGTDRQVIDAIDPVFEFLATGYSVGLAFEIPIGNRQYRGAERVARANYFLAMRILNDREHAVASEVRDALRNINYLADQVRETTRAREVAARQLEAEQRRLKEGASTNFQVLEFQRDLAEALTNERRARFGYANAVTRLSLVQGLNWDGSAPVLPGLDGYAPDDAPME